MILKLSKPLYRIGIIRKAGIIICLDNRIFIMLKKFYWAPKLFSPEQGSLNGDSTKKNAIKRNTVLK